MSEAILKEELVRLMPVKKDDSQDYDTSDSPLVCRWCRCYLTGHRIFENHKWGCFAARHLGRPHAARPIEER